MNKHIVAHNVSVGMFILLIAGVFTVFFSTAYSLYQLAETVPQKAFILGLVAIAVGIIVGPVAHKYSND